jgi:class 3 adenylate cyclase
MAAMEPQIRYCATADGVSIAYTVFGEGTPVVYASNIMGDVHWYANNEHTKAQMVAIADAGCQVVRYDMRGMGSSDRDVSDLSIAARVLDLEAVVDELEIERFALCGYTHGNCAAVAYANAHPERVTQLVLVNPYATGEEYYTKVPGARTMRALKTMAADDWEFFTLTIASAISGHTDPTQAQQQAKLFRSSLTPQVYLAFVEEAVKSDLRDMLSRIVAPTLVVIDPAGVGNADLSKGVASRIRGARLVTTEDYTRDLLTFVGIEAPGASQLRRAPASGGTAVILFTDIADSTAMTERLGDAAFRIASRALDERTRSAIREAGGSPVEGKVLGDGVMGVFSSAAQAIDAARRCLDASRESELPVHIGLHAGDVIREPGNVYGGAVNIASRICGLCAPGEILVSATVRDLARTSAGVTFEDRGEHALKGIADPVRVFAVRAEA